MKSHAQAPLVIGPLLGYFVSCAVEHSVDGYSAVARVAASESGLEDDEALARVAVGPCATEALARGSLISRVRWQIENRSGPFAPAAA